MSAEISAPFFNIVRFACVCAFFVVPLQHVFEQSGVIYLRFSGRVLGCAPKCGAVAIKTLYNVKDLFRFLGARAKGTLLTS